MKLFKPPFSESNDYYDQSKIRMIWNVALAVIILLSIVSISNINNVGHNHFPHLSGISICIIALTVIKLTKKYKVISIFTVSSVFVTLSLTFILLKNTPHYTTPLWMTLNILITFFILGKRWGALFLGMHFSVFFIYFWLFYKSNMDNLRELTQLDIVNYIIESALIGFGFFYILMQFIKSSTYAEDQVKNINLRLMKQNELVNSQNKEKEVMLREIHHRVKNNLQVITGLLKMQSLELKGDEGHKAFEEAISRVKSMALIHEKIYKSDTLVNFDLKNYLESLTKEILETYSVERKINLNVYSEKKNIGQKGIVPLSILFNELISNSIKHGLKNTEHGEISVNLKKINNDYFQLDYSDNGQWIKPNHSSFGLELISSMTKQLEGSSEFSIDETGTHYSFKLKIIEE